MLWMWGTEFSSLGGPLGIRPQHQMSDEVWSARNTQYNADNIYKKNQRDAAWQYVYL